MRCEKARKWISDDLDGRLSESRAQALGRHLGSCSACRAYRDDIALIQARMKAQKAPALAAEDWGRFERDLEREIRRAPGRGSPTELNRGFKLKMTWAGAAAALVVGVAAFYLTTSRSAGLDPAFLSYEDSLGQIYREIRDNPGLADSFNRLVMASIADSVRAGQTDLPTDLLANPDFLEGWVGGSPMYFREENGPDTP